MVRRFASPASLAVSCLLSCAISLQVAAETPEPKTYNWIAEFVAADAPAKTITVKARIPDYISKYVDRFKPGDHVMLIWNMLPPPPEAPSVKAQPPAASQTDASKAPAETAKVPPVVLKTESDLLLAIDSYDATKSSKIDSGYILPAEFVAAEAHTVTVKLRVPDNALRAVASIPPGRALRATSPMSQPTDVAAVSALTEHSPAAGTTTK